MEVYIENNKFYKKGLLSSSEIPASDIKLVEIGSSTITLHLNSGKVLTAKAGLGNYFETLSYYESNNVSFVDKTHEGKQYSSSELSDKLEEVKSRSIEIASKLAKQYLGENFDVELRIAGEPSYSILVIYLTENGCLLEDHPAYGLIDECGVESALEEIDLSFLVKHDAASLETYYGVTEEVEDYSALEEYINSAFKYRLEE